MNGDGWHTDRTKWCIQLICRSGPGRVGVHTRSDTVEFQCYLRRDRETFRERESSGAARAVLTWLVGRGASGTAAGAARTAAAMFSSQAAWPDRGRSPPGLCMVELAARGIYRGGEIDRSLGLGLLPDIQKPSLRFQHVYWVMRHHNITHHALTIAPMSLCVAVNTTIHTSHYYKAVACWLCAESTCSKLAGAIKAQETRGPELRSSPSCRV